MVKKRRKMAKITEKDQKLNIFHFVKKEFLSQLITNLL